MKHQFFFVYSVVIVGIMRQYPAVCGRRTKGDAKYKCAVRNVIFVSELI